MHCAAIGKQTLGKNMQIDGQQLISRATYVSSRSLMTTGAIVLLSHYYAFDLSELNLFGVSPGAAAIEGTLTILLLFLWLNHFLSWLGDRNSFQEWNSGKNVGGPSLYGGGGSEFQRSFANAMVRINEYKETLEQFERSLRRQDDLKNQDSYIQTMKKCLNSIDDRLKKLQRASKDLGTHAKVYLYGWFLVLPTFSTIWAIVVVTGLVPAKE